MKKLITILILASTLFLGGCATGPKETIKPQAGFYQAKGVNTGQVRSRSKAGETSYTATRYVEDSTGSGGHWSTVVIDSRKDAKLAGNVSGLVSITNEATIIKFGAGSVDSAGTSQVSAQGSADADRISAVGEVVDELTNPLPMP